MSQIPTPPPSSRGVSAEPPSSYDDECKNTTLEDNKVQLLDELLERYLNLLDRHQKLQESLGKQLSSVCRNIQYNITSVLFIAILLPIIAENLRLYMNVANLISSLTLSGILSTYTCQLLLTRSKVR
jgi:hypothetical protein